MPIPYADLFAEWHAKREERRMWRPMLCTNYVWLLPHGLPNAKRRCVHIEQSYLLTAVAS